MKSIKRHLFDALPLIAIALVVVVIHPRFFSPAAEPLEEEERNPKVVTVPPHRQLPQSERRRVINIHDGDSITLESRGGKEKIRLCGVDAPEISQSLGVQSRDNLRSLIAAAGNQVYITPIEKDRYGRTVAEVFVVMGDGEEKLAQEEQLKSGMAYVYEQYVSSCLNADSMKNAEAIARNARLGVWGGSYQKPWDYRRAKRN